MEATGIAALVSFIILITVIFYIGLHDVIIAFLLQKILEPTVKWIQRVFFGIDRARTGDEALIGSRAVAGQFTQIEERSFAGSVVVDGETWSAYSTSPVEKGSSVSVIERNKLQLFVEPLNNS